MKKLLVLSLCLVAGSLFAQPVIPGEYTDPSNLKKVFDSPRHFKAPVERQFPYMSLYYVKPIVTTDEKVEISYYVTDYNHSQERFRDNTHRFDVYLKIVTETGRELKRTKSDVGAGDGKFAFKPFPKGEYEVCVWAVDRANKLESHRVWHSFRVVTPEDLKIPADKVYAVTADDLKSYEIDNMGDLGRKVLVEVPQPPKKMAFLDQFKMYKEVVTKYAAENPPKRDDGKVGYTVYIPARDGNIIFNSWRALHVVNDPSYDTNKIEQAAIKTAEGLQKLLNDKAAAGFRKVVMLPGTYRMSAFRSLSLPSDMTLDLNGATLKENAFAGVHSVIVRISNVKDAHLVNGTLEGDYFEHYYDALPNNPEWPMGFIISAEATDCSVENVLVKDITGYGAGNGMGKRNGSLHRYHRGLGKFVAGALDPKTGKLVEDRKLQFTSGFVKVEPEKIKRIQISKYLGYQGIASQQWQLTGCWYDKDKNFISSETIYQYREIPIPANAAYLRVTQLNWSLEEANKSGLTICAFFIPRNCTIKNCTFDRARCVGYAASAMRNFLFEGNFFTRCGESAAKCAFDAEDGWDMMQDTTFIANRCRGNMINNSLLTCCGHNFIFEKNDCALHFWGRTHSPCVRDNNLTTGSFYCDSQNRSGYGRFARNTYSRGLSVPQTKSESRLGWDFAFVDMDLTTAQTNNNAWVSLSDTARLVNSKASNRAIAPANAVGCYFENCQVNHIGGGRWNGVVMKGGKFNAFRNKNVFDKCKFTKTSFGNFMDGKQTFMNCEFDGCSFVGISGGSMEFENCRFTNSSMWNGYWVKASNIKFKNCTFDVPGKCFLRLGSYGIGEIEFDSCKATTSAKGGVIFCDISDWRSSNPGDTVAGRITVANCTFGSGFDCAVGCSTFKWGADAKKKNPKKLTKSVTFVSNRNKMFKGAPVLGDLPATIPPPAPANPAEKK